MATLLRRLLDPGSSARTGITDIGWDAYQLQIAESWTATVGTSPTAWTFERAMTSNPIIFACWGQRQRLFAEVRLAYQHLVKGRPGEIWGDERLAALETPWPGASTAEMLALIEMHVTAQGNAYVEGTEPGELALLDPSLVEILVEEVRATPNGPVLRRRKVGYSVRDRAGAPSRLLDIGDVAHYIERPDPAHAGIKGMSWLRAAITEVRTDDLMTAHKGKFFEKAATPNLVIKTEKKLDDDQYSRLQDSLERRHSGVDNAYRTLVLEGGSDVIVAGKDMRQTSFRDVQDAGENRTVLTSGVPAPVVGVALGSSPTYNNFSTARRHFVDSWGRPSWRGVCSALSTIHPAPSGSRLWYDARDVAALQQDESDEAAIRAQDASVIRTLVDGGFEPASAVLAVTANDMNLLVHSGNLSVQLVAATPLTSGGDDD